MSPLFEDDVYAAVSLNACVSGRKVYGGPAKESMLAHMEKAKAFLAGI
jgi:argininosuccinate lyase